MADVLLEWSVIALPTILAIAIEIASERVRRSWRWKICVLGAGICISLLTFWQQNRARDAFEKARDETVDKITNSVKQSVLSVVNSLPKSMSDAQTPSGPHTASKRFTITVGPPLGCFVEASIRSEVVSRLYARGIVSTEGDQSLPVEFQELFYEWSVHLTPTIELPSLVAEIDHLEEGDLIKTMPDTANLSGPNAKWFSGFPEPARTKGDYYAQTVTFHDLRKRETAFVSLRRRLEQTSIPDLYVPRLADMRVARCSTPLPMYQPGVEALRFSQQAKALANFRYGRQIGPPRPVPVRNDPGDLSPNEVQATVEARCKDDECTAVIIGNLEAHVGKPAKEHN